MRDLPDDVWELIHADAKGRLPQELYANLKKVPPDSSLETPVLRPGWSKIIESSVDLNRPYYRGIPSEDVISLKRDRIREARSRLRPAE